MGVYKYKQSIIVRADLNMPKGKMAAQVAHASMGAILKYVTYKCVDNSNVIYEANDRKAYHIYKMEVPAPVHEWLAGDFAKIVLKCQSLDDLLGLMIRAEKRGVPYKLIKDNGATFFDKPTVTCIAVGPWDAEVIDEMTKEFKLM